ncbi:Non-histone chromosomal protein 6 [Basidiobolus ranarum]|uniref:Non-histone chromosomal protein 6 n=1 Tax=Basidiobolus ranarum TaxID=34480 RepID=A0ABR2WBQ5_9FUNG
MCGAISGDAIGQDEHKNANQRTLNWYFQFLTKFFIEKTMEYSGVKKISNELTSKRIDAGTQKSYSMQKVICNVVSKPKRLQSNTSNEKGVKRGRKSKTDKGDDDRKKDRPKRPRSSYIIFATEQRASEKENNPDASPSDLVKLLAARWKTMGEDEKKPYAELAVQDKARYEGEMSNYTLIENLKSVGAEHTVTNHKSEGLTGTD